MYTGESKLGNTIAPVQKQSVAAEVVSYVERLANRAQQLTERVDMKLHPIMTSDQLQPKPTEVTDKVGREYPPLFAGIQSKLYEISCALESIERALDRTEL